MIEEKTQKEIIALFDKRLDQVTSENALTYDFGYIQGLYYARTLIREWNQPNHGMVVAKPAKARNK